MCCRLKMFPFLTCGYYILRSTQSLWSFSENSPGRISSPDSLAGYNTWIRLSVWSDSSGSCLNIWPSSAGGRWIPGGGGPDESLRAAADSLGSAHSSPGQQSMLLAGSDSDHSEPRQLHPAKTLYIYMCVIELLLKMSRFCWHSPYFTKNCYWSFDSLYFSI